MVEKILNKFDDELLGSSCVAHALHYSKGRFAPT